MRSSGTADAKNKVDGATGRLGLRSVSINCGLYRLIARRIGVLQAGIAILRTERFIFVFSFAFLSMVSILISVFHSCCSFLLLSCFALLICPSVLIS